MKNARVYIETEKKKIPLVFNLNVMEEIQEKYGTLGKWGEITTGDGEPKVKDLKAGIMAMMNEAIDIENEKPYFNNIKAGLCGPAVKPIALRMVCGMLQKQ